VTKLQRSFIASVGYEKLFVSIAIMGGGSVGEFSISAIVIVLAAVCFFTDGTFLLHSLRLYLWLSKMVISTLDVHEQR